MNPLRQLDDRLLMSINDFARHTPWLHAPMLGYATYGVVLFAALLLLGLLLTRHATSRRLAAAGWAVLATLIALALTRRWDSCSMSHGPTSSTRRFFGSQT